MVPTASSPPCSNACLGPRRRRLSPRRLKKTRRWSERGTAGMQDRYFSHMLGGLVRDFGEPAVIWQALVLLGLLAVAWWLARVLRRRLEERRQSRFEALRFGAE